MNKFFRKILELFGIKPAQQGLPNADKYLANVNSGIATCNESEDDELNINVLNKQGNIVLSTMELKKFPERGSCINVTNGSGARLLEQITGELIKGSVNKTNKILQVVFKPEIQKGLDAGEFVLMRTKENELLSDVINISSKKIIGKGRVVQNGRVKQLAVGAYQLVSFAVAQSHLAEIERSLQSVNNKIDQILERMEATDRAAIKGGITYFEEILNTIKNNQIGKPLSLPVQNTIADLIKSSYAWNAKLNEDIESLISKINQQSDIDNWGGSENNHRALMDHVKNLDDLIERYRLIADFSRILNYSIAFIDPERDTFQIGFILKSERWFTKLNDLNNLMEEKIKILIKSKFNSDETLRLRQSEVRSRMIQCIGKDKEYINNCERFIDEINKEILRRIGSLDGVRLAISFDENGAVQRAEIT